MGSSRERPARAAGTRPPSRSWRRRSCRTCPCRFPDPAILSSSPVPPVKCPASLSRLENPVASPALPVEAKVIDVALPPGSTDVVPVLQCRVALLFADHLRLSAGTCAAFRARGASSTGTESCRRRGAWPGASATSIEVRSGFSHSSVPEIFVEGGEGVVAASRGARVSASLRASAVPRDAKRRARPRRRDGSDGDGEDRGLHGPGDLPGARLRSRPSRRAEVRDLVSRIAFRLLK